MDSYAVFIHFDLLLTVPKRGSQRKLIMDHIRGLGSDPFQPSDFELKDENLRMRQVKVIGDYAITYWVDHPVRAVMVTDVSPSGL